MWQAVEIGWTKPEEVSTDWDDAKIKAANFNSRALNALFNAVTNKQFKKISSTETTKEAWTILQTTYEGTKDVKDSKLQRLTTSFEEIKMEENESFNEFYAKLKDIVNSAFNWETCKPMNWVWLELGKEAKVRARHLIGQKRIDPLWLINWLIS